MELYGNRKKKKKDEGTAKAETKPSEKSRQKKALRRALTLLGVIVLALVGVVVAYSIWEKPPETANNKKPPSASVSPKPGDGVKAPASSGTPDNQDDPVDDFDGALLTDRDDGIYTFLLVGRDHESNSTDTIIVGKLDTNKHTIDCVNIPRDTMANISWGSTPKKINAVYPGYFNSGKDAIEGLKTHVKNLVGFDVDCYAVVNLNVVEDVINEVGGVYFDVPIDMDYDDGDQHFHVHLKSGYQLLNGYETLGVFRYRYSNNGGGYPGGDLERIGVQQNLLKAIASQMLSLGNIPNLTNIIQLCLDNVETDLDASNMAFFARQFLMCSPENVNFQTAPIGASCTINNISYVSLDVESWLDVVNDCLNPYKEPVTTANVNILTSNGSGSYMTATTGAIAGGPDSFACNQFGCELRGSYHAPGAHVTPEPVVSEPDTTDPVTGTETETGYGDGESEGSPVEPEPEPEPDISGGDTGETDTGDGGEQPIIITFPLEIE